MIDDDRLKPEQRAAKDALDRNVSLSAGAGTGKTTTLTARYVAIVERELATVRERLDDGSYTREAAVEHAASIPEHVLTTTFTDRAAADLTGTVREEINAKLSVADDEETFALWRAVGDALDDAYVQTLHSLCRRLLEERAIGGLDTPRVDPSHRLSKYGMTYVDLDVGFDVVEEDEAEELAREAAAATLREEESDAIGTLARRYDRGTVEDICYDLLTTSPRSDAYAWLEWMAEVDDADAYAERILGLAIEVSPEDVLSVWDAIADALPVVLANRDAGSANPTKWAINPIVSTAERVGITDHATFESASYLDRVEFVYGLADAVTKGSGEQYDHDSLLPTAHDPDAAPENDTDRLYTAVWQITEAVPADWSGQSLNSDLEHASYEYVEAFATVATAAFERYAEAKHRDNVVDFGDLIALANHFLGQLDAADRREFGFFADGVPDGPDGYVMVDEFQDTNADQWRVARLLASPAPDDVDTTNLFVVGDDKQSIYRFRGADVSVFTEADEALAAANDRAGVAVEQAPLTTNFRTLPEPLHAINGLFDRVFPRRDGDSESPTGEWASTDEDGTVAAFEATSEPLESARRSTTGDGDRIAPSVEYMPVPVDAEQQADLLPDGHQLREERRDDGNALEAKAVATRVAQLLSDGTRVFEAVDDDHPEYDRLAHDDDGVPVERTRDVEPDDVAILLSSRGGLDEYERELRELGVPYTVIKGAGLFDSPEVTTLVNLLRVLVDPTNDRALYGLLRSPMFGRTDDELAQLAATRGADESLWTALQAADYDEWVAVAEDLHRFRAYAGAADHDEYERVATWSALLTRVLDETGFLATVGADERGDKAVANVDEFRSRLRAFSEDGVHSLAEVLDRIERRADSDARDAEANVVEFDHGDGDGGGVNLLTIHESKGMEYEIVVVPKLGRNFQSASGARLADSVEFELVEGKGDRVPLFGIKGPNPEDPYDDMATVARDIAQQHRRAEERAEQKRLLYVAATRARDHLLLSGQHKGGDDDYPAGFEAPDPESATTWRDWVQAVLFDGVGCSDGDDAAAVVGHLRRDGEYERSLPYDLRGEQAVGSVTVRLPPADATYDTPASTADLGVAEFVDGVTTTGPTVLEVSPSDCTALRRREMRLERHGNRIVAVDTDDTARSRRSDHESGRTATPGDLPATAYGELLHRLCEVQPPDDRVHDFAREVLAGHDDPVVVDQGSLDDVLDAAARTADQARTRIDEVLAGVGEDVLARYDEYRLDVEIDGDDLGVDRVDLGGEIDHLAVTDDTYHVFDYKTDRAGSDDADALVEARMTHHEPQMLAYAAALRAADPTRNVVVQLVFTDLDCHVARMDETDDAIDRLVDMLDTHI
ncbi:UvrD-helicase domain-containing protein [Halobaculum litoreum]|uniref:UvrD-helicase domain-containing protein n=1 Tax=Halobaculum litoreum TaxID=3031998 RepID=UPI0024C33CC7|nr:UvrD-helicase domain-containing protein [Halobaculum sp. DT92]